jgi:predicted RNase H-like nuclease (RuvC/YqgF family)
MQRLYRPRMRKSMLNLGLFSFRAPQRDWESDQARLAVIRKALRAATTNAETELKGLRRRLESARRSAALLFTNLDNGNLEETNHSELKSVENRLLSAEKRAKQLVEHLAELRKIENVVDAAANSCQPPSRVRNDKAVEPLAETEAKAG